MSTWTLLARFRGSGWRVRKRCLQTFCLSGAGLGRARAALPRHISIHPSYSAEPDEDSHNRAMPSFPLALGKFVSRDAVPTLVGTRYSADYPPSHIFTRQASRD